MSRCSARCTSTIGSPSSSAIWASFRATRRRKPRSGSRRSPPPWRVRWTSTACSPSRVPPRRCPFRLPAMTPSARPRPPAGDGIWKTSRRNPHPGLFRPHPPSPSSPLPQAGEGGEPSALRATSIRLGIARDSAFGFYYPGDLEALRAAGAALVSFNALRDTRLPEVDALFIGGGFPETHMQALEQNAPLRRDVRRAIEGGMPVYAECGGLM